MNFEEINSQNKEQPLFESDESESEFDAFEHHLSQYERKNEELFSDDEPMEHDGDRSITEDDNQISLATSFYRNAQNQNEDFLDGKFNGDQLLDPFSEDKFIKCKYSEDFYVEPTNGRPLFSDAEEREDASELFNSELFNSEQCLAVEKLAEERSSEDERVIENRKRHFLEFISTIPKVCTPSVCGLMQSPRESPSEQPATLNRLTEANEEILFEDDEHELVTSTQKDSQSNAPLDDRFNWSIDQLATLNPVDISINERRYRRFKDFESDQLTQQKLSRENELFFSQDTIAPSPTRRVFKNIGLGDKSMHDADDSDEGCMHEKTSVFEQVNERSLMNDQSMRSEAKRMGDEKETGKDSGNYSGEDSRQTMTNPADRQYDEFEFSFMRHPCNKRISNIDFECDLSMEQHATETPNLRQESDQQKSAFSFHLPSDRPAATGEWTNLDFKPTSSLQTSTPCTSLFKAKEFGQMENELVEQSARQSMPLQERANSVKQKRRLFHHLSPQNDSHQDVTEDMSSVRSTSVQSTNTPSSSIQSIIKSSARSANDHRSTSDPRTNASAIYSYSNGGEVSLSKSTNHSSNNSSSLQLSDEGIYGNSKEVTFGGSNESSMMSVCDNNSLTPKLRKSRSITKSFAERLDELELFTNDENKSLNTSHANYSRPDSHQNSTSRWMHNLTDSNCFMIKNFNNFNVNLNNSDSGCYISNASSGSSG